MKYEGVVIREVTLDEGILKLLLSMSKAWAEEQNVYGYVANQKSDIEGKRVFLAFDGEVVVGYVLGNGYRSKNMKSIMAEGSACFEIDEMYVIPSCRSKGVGKTLIDSVCSFVKEEYEYITLTTATKNHKAILHFYIDEVGMNFWSARLYKRI